MVYVVYIVALRVHLSLTLPTLCIRSSPTSSSTGKRLVGNSLQVVSCNLVFLSFRDPLDLITHWGLIALNCKKLHFYIYSISISLICVWMVFKTFSTTGWSSLWFLLEPADTVYLQTCHWLHVDIVRNTEKHGKRESRTPSSAQITRHVKLTKKSDGMSPVTEYLFIFSFQNYLNHDYIFSTIKYFILNFLIVGWNSRKIGGTYSLSAWTEMWAKMQN